MSSPHELAGELQHLDVLVVGAGISGINAAYHLSQSCPDRNFAVLDALESFGGTWLTHSYPGVRSDTEIYTLGYSFKPWTGSPYASAEEIRSYLGETIEEFDLGHHFHFQYQIHEARWSSEDQYWSVTGTRGPDAEAFSLTTNFLWMCHGYYRQGEGHTPSWPGMEEFKGSWIHPQSWPKNPEIADREVVVIGSGATTATLVPNIADECSHITILQRSPTYFFQSPNADPLADQLRGLDTPEEWIHDIIRRKSMADMQSMTQIQMLHPDLSKAGLVQMVAAQLPEGYDVETHFTPRHLPHEQRICRILDGDLFKKISEGRVSMVTDEIECFTADGITTKGGEHLKADVVITATGFNLTVLGDVAFYVDGEAVDFANSFTYRGIMFTGVPNMAWTFGALRVSWTMRADLVSQFLCRLLKEMEATQASSVVAKLRSQDASMEIGPFIDPAQFNPGYAQRSRDLMPRSGSKPEWQLSLDYWAERDVLPTADLHDGCLIFNASN